MPTPKNMKPEQVELTEDNSESGYESVESGSDSSSDDDAPILEQATTKLQEKRQRKQALLAEYKRRAQAKMAARRRQNKEFDAILDQAVEQTNKAETGAEQERRALLFASCLDDALEDVAKQQQATFEQAATERKQALLAKYKKRAKAKMAAKRGGNKTAEGTAGQGQAAAASEAPNFLRQAAVDSHRTNQASRPGFSSTD